MSGLTYYLLSTPSTPFTQASVDHESSLALDFPPQCPQKQTGLGFHKGTCFADKADSCALCITGDGLCKPILGSITVKKVWEDAECAVRQLLAE